MAQRIKQTTDHLVHDLRGATGRWWRSTRRAAEGAGARAGGVRKRARCRLDLAAVRRKVAARCEELGRAVWLAHREGERSPLDREEVARLLSQLEVLRQREETLALELPPRAARRGGADLHP